MARKPAKAKAPTTAEHLAALAEGGQNNTTAIMNLDRALTNRLNTTQSRLHSLEQIAKKTSHIMPADKRDFDNIRKQIFTSIQTLRTDINTLDAAGRETNDRIGLVAETAAAADMLLSDGLDMIAQGLVEQDTELRIELTDEFEAITEAIVDLRADLEGQKDAHTGLANTVRELSRKVNNDAHKQKERNTLIRRAGGLGAFLVGIIGLGCSIGVWASGGDLQTAWTGAGVSVSLMFGGWAVAQ